jgi:putative methanogen marker protein 4
MNRGHRTECRVGIGLPEATASELRKHMPRGSRRLKVIAFTNPSELVSSLRTGEIDCAVRGTLSSVQVLGELKHAFSLRQVMRTAILEDCGGRQFLLTPVGIDEGMDRRSRLELVEKSIDYFSALGWIGKIGVLSKGREEDWERSSEVEASLRDGDWLVETLKRQDRNVEHYSILIEDAVSQSDLVLAPDGISGNLIFRSMHFLGGGKAYGAPVVNMSSVFVDTSRAKCDFSDSVSLAAGLFQMKKAGRG